MLHASCPHAVGLMDDLILTCSIYANDISRPGAVCGRNGNSNALKITTAQE
jgi:hypothetical protein